MADQIIDVPNIGQIKFPASMSDAEIVAAIQKMSQPQSMSASDVARQAVGNFPASMSNMLGGIYEAVTNPIQTGKAVLDVAAGGLQNILPDSIVNAIGRDQSSIDAANRLGQFYVQRYGGVENAKRTIANDPAGFMADVSTILTGGSTVAPKLGVAASFVDPLSLAAKATTATAKGGAKLAGEALGLTTGAGSESLKQAYRAGREGGNTSQQFRENISGRAPVTEVLDMAKQNLSDMNTAKQAEYRSGMVNIKNDKSILDFAGIDKSMNNATNKTTYKGKIVNERAASELDQVKNIVNDWKAQNPAEYHTPEGLDALKKRVGDVLEGIPYEQKTARAAVGEIYKSIKSEITKQAPTYANVMKQYSESSDLIKEIERSLSLGNKASADTGIRKLQSLMRNNVNTNYGQRSNLAQQLVQQGGQDIFPALAGQALSQITPRGLQRATAIPQSLGAFSLGGIPAAAGSLFASSPRAVGESAYGLGLLGRGLDTASNAVPLAFDPRAYNLMYQAGRIKGQ
jgi:hypothetical protein